jgi:hypothetical protein
MTDHVMTRKERRAAEEAWLEANFPKYAAARRAMREFAESDEINHISDLGTLARIFTQADGEWKECVARVRAEAERCLRQWRERWR